MSKSVFLSLVQTYLEKFRNLDFLEHELEGVHQFEKSKAANTEKQLRKMQEKIKKEEERLMHGANEERDIDDVIDRRGVNSNMSRPSKPRGVRGSMGMKE